MDNKMTPDDYSIEDILEEARTMRERQDMEHPRKENPVEERKGSARAQAEPVGFNASSPKKKKKRSRSAQQEAEQSASLQEQPPKVKEPKPAAPMQKEPNCPVPFEEPKKKEPPMLHTAELESLLAPQPPTHHAAEWEAEDEEEILPLVTPNKLTWRERRAEKKRVKEELRHAKRVLKGIEEEDDIYYGLQLKPLVEYKQDYEKTMMHPKTKPQAAPPKSTFSYLFDSTDDELDEEIAARFSGLHKERRQRMARTAKETGVEQEDIFNLCQQTNTVELKFYKKAQQEKLKEESIVQEEAEPDLASVLPHIEKEIQPALLPYVGEGQTFEFPCVGELNRSPRAVRTDLLENGTFELPAVFAEEKEPIYDGESPTRPSAPTEPSKPSQPQEEPSQKPDDEPTEEPHQEPQEIPIPQETVQPVEVPEPIRAEEGEPKQPQFPQKISAIKSDGENEKKPNPPRSLQEYRPAGASPVHVIELHDFASVISREAKTYPKAAPLHIPSSTMETPLREVIQQKKVTTEVQEEQDVPLEESVIEAFPAKEQPSLEKEKKFTILGEEEPDNDPQENLPEREPDELDDYQSPADASSVQHELDFSLRELFLRLSVTGILLILMLALGLVAEMPSMLPKVIRVSMPMQIYLILNLIFLGIASLFSGVTLCNGIKALFHLQANSDSGVALAAISAFLQGVTLLFAVDSVAQAKLHSYAVLAVMGLFLNTAGKFSLVKRISHNFHFIASPDQKYVVELFDDHNTSLQMAKDCVAETPMIAYQHRADFLKHFLRLSYENDPSDQSSQMITPIGAILSLVLCGVCFFVTGSTLNAFTALTAGMCMCVPMVNMLCVNLPLARVTKVATRCGAMLTGYPAVERFSNTNAVMLDAKDLFPKGTVILNGIKTFAGQRIDDAIMDATALMYATGGPLSDLFDQIIKSRREMLPKIQNITYEDGKGVTGWVSGRRVLVGNRELMISHSIEPPSRDYEEKYLMGGKQIVYFASGGDLMAMFVVSYNSDRRRAMELRRMEDNGISLIVRTCDPNITPSFLSEVFMLGQHSIGVMPQRLGQVYEELVKKPPERAGAYVATKGRPTAMMRMLTACVRQRANISIAVAMQNVAVVLGFLLVAFLSCYSGLGQLTTGALLLFELFWIAAILLVPKLRRP